MISNDTIVALSTPPGRSGIGVIRLSGAQVLEYLKVLCFDNHFEPQIRHAQLKKIYDPETHELLDTAIVIYFRAPHSFTGEDVVELSCHGSPVLLSRIIRALFALGARAADAGEFTLRALENERLDLVEAEAIRDLIDAQTYAAVRQSARQLNGEFSATLQPLKDALLEIIVRLESALEFVEDDLPDFAFEKTKTEIKNLIVQINNLTSTFSSGRLLKEGARIALIGRPNVGKSSLFNALIKTDRAIVTEIPGTTRDTLSEFLDFDGIPVQLTDTAGIRESSDIIERIGIERTRRAISDADLIIVILDGTEKLNGEDRAVLTQVGNSKYFVTRNKSDAADFRASDTILNGHFESINISAKTGVGLDKLREKVKCVFFGATFEDSSFLVTNARHHDLLKRAATELENSLSTFEIGASEEVVLIGLHNALKLLGEITGETTSEDVLTKIFSTFCIGK